LYLRLLLMMIFCATLFLPGLGEADDDKLITVYLTQDQLPESSESSLWDQAQSSEVTLYPQVSVGSGPGGKHIHKSGKASVKGLYNEKEVALLIEWSQPDSSITTGIGKFADALAIQVPLRYGPDNTLPYIGMGNAGAPVGIWFWRADGSVQTLAAEGFGSLTSQDSDGVVAKGSYENGKWRVVVKRSLEAAGSENAINITPQKQPLVPVSFAIWDGGDDQRDGLKRLSSWRFLRFDNVQADQRYLNSLTDEQKLNGNVRKGRALMEKEGCSDCHTYPASKDASDVGPDLTYAGGIHLTEYLLESIKSPSAVIVPGKDYYTVEDGSKVSAMPHLELNETDVADLVEYLKTLR
jgi:DMSO reductase family type II enzyme heme b subunit